MNEWLPTHGKRPDLPDDAAIVYIRNSWGSESYPNNPQPFSYWKDCSWKALTHYRLAGLVNAAQEQEKRSGEGVISQSYRNDPPPVPAAAPSRGHCILSCNCGGENDYGQHGVCCNISLAGASGPIDPAQANPQRPRRDKFGLLNKWPETKVRKVLPAPPILSLTMAGWRPQGKLFGHRSE